MRRGTIMHGVMRRIISRLANFTPTVVYYAEGWPVWINDRLVDLKAKEEGKQSPVSTAAIAMACSLHVALPNIGDSATMTLSGVEYRGKDIGHFIVTTRRVSEEEADAIFGDALTKETAA